MPNPYVNKVVQSNGTTLIDISDTTAVAADVASGKYFYLASGQKVEGTASGGGDEPTYETYFDDSINVGEHGISIASLADLYFAQGETWRVTWDGVEYLCDTAEYQGWLWTIGNQSLASTDDGVNEPFLLYNYGGGAMNGNARTGGTHTLKLEKQTSSGGGGGGGSTNPLSGKILSTTGDSIAAGAGNNGSGYPEIVASDNGMTVQNVAVGGGTVAYVNANTFCISRSISSMRSDADFVLLEGGGNDADSGVPLGTLSSGYTATLDDTTFAGAIESMFKATLARFPDKKIGYVFIHKCATLFDSRVPNSYYDMAKSACEKWGIPYLDLNTQVPPLNYIADLKSTYTANGDGYHPNELGYRTFYVPKITAFLNTMLTDNSLINKIVTANGTYSASDDSADGYSSVTVNVPSGGLDVPTFTVTYDDNWNNIISVTCNKTIAECIATVDGGHIEAVIIETTQSGTEEYGAAGQLSLSGSGNLTYTTYNTNLPLYDIVYSANGTLTVVKPSRLEDTLNVTVNGTYTPTDKIWTEVNVNVPTSGSSKNVQTEQSTTRRNNTALGSIISLTCSTAGTYDVYWTCARSSTSGTWGSQLYINGTAYGTENTTFSNNVQNNHLTGVQIPANATVAVYGRSRSGYYIYVPQLTIVQTA